MQAGFWVGLGGGEGQQGSDGASGHLLARPVQKGLPRAVFALLMQNCLAATVRPKHTT